MKALAFVALAVIPMIADLIAEGYHMCPRTPEYFKNLTGDLERDAKLVVTDREDIKDAYEAIGIKVILVDPSTDVVVEGKGYSLEGLTKAQMVAVLERVGITDAMATETVAALQARFTADLDEAAVKIAIDEVSA